MIEVRDATPDDAGGIAAVRVRGWQEAYRGLLPEDGLDRLSIERDTEIWRGRLERPPPDGVMVVADAAGIVGFCAGGPDRDDDSLGEIYALYVHPDRWRGGIGTRLLEAATSRLEAAGFTELVLWVLATNTPARRFYESLGWVHDGAEKGDEIFGFSLHEARYRRGGSHPRGRNARDVWWKGPIPLPPSPAGSQGPSPTGVGDNSR